MPDLDRIFESIENMFDVMAENDVPFCKQIKAIITVVLAGRNFVDGIYDDAYNNYMKVLKYDLKQLAKSPHTDLTHLNALMERLRVSVIRT